MRERDADKTLCELDPVKGTYLQQLGFPTGIHPNSKQFKSYSIAILIFVPHQNLQSLAKLLD